MVGRMLVRMAQSAEALMFVGIAPTLVGLGAHVCRHGAILSGILLRSHRNPELLGSTWNRAGGAAVVSPALQLGSRLWKSASPVGTTLSSAPRRRPDQLNRNENAPTIQTLTRRRLGEDGAVIQHFAMPRIALFFVPVPSRVLHRRPMLLRNPFTLVQCCPDHRSANFAAVISPLGPISVVVKKS